MSRRQIVVFGHGFAVLVAALGLFVAAGCEEDAETQTQSSGGGFSLGSGTPDTQFGTLGVVSFGNATSGVTGDMINSIALDSDGFIYAAGTRSNTSGSDAGDMAIWKMRPNGAPDTNFGVGGVFVYDAGALQTEEGFAIRRDLNNNLVVAGSRTMGAQGREFTIWRVQPNGTLDPSFGTSGVQTFVDYGGGGGPDVANGIAVDGSGNVIVAGARFNGTSDDWVVTRLFAADGSQDPVFAGSGQYVVGTGSGEQGWGVIMDGTGHVLVAGIGTCNCVSIHRLTLPGGTLDGGFGVAGIRDLPMTGATGVGTNANNVRLRKDGLGRIYVVGSLNFGVEADDLVAWRLSATGAVDTNFGGGSGFVRLGGSVPGNDQNGFDVAIDSSNRLIVVGTTDDLGDQNVIIARFLPDGLLDNSFGENFGPFEGYIQYGSVAGGGGSNNDSGNAIAIQPDGRILIGGSSDIGAPQGLQAFVLRIYPE